MEIFYNTLTDSYDIVADSKILYSIKGEDIDTFEENLSQSIMKAKALRNVALAKKLPTPKETIPLEYLTLDVVDEGGYELDDIIGLSIEMGWSTEFNGPNGVGVYALLKDGETYYIEQGIAENFLDAQYKSDGIPVSNVEIVRCLEDDLIQYIKERPSFQFIFCGQTIPHNVLFDQENTTFYTVMEENYFL